jgi:hypothetical protein
VGPPIPPRALEGEAGEVTGRLKAYVETVLPHDPERPFA